VLKAINIPFEHAAGTLRLSTGIYTTQNDLDRAADAILTALKRSECALSMHVKQ
jgi:cysteine sulfinate desulfinase/cysteine desulfurase-like protein